MARRARDVSAGEVAEAQRSASELALVAELLARPEPIERTPAASNYAGLVACEKVSPGPLYQTLGLRFGKGERPFGIFDSGTMRVVIPAASHRTRELHVTSDNGGLVVHAIVESSELALYPSAPMLFAGFVFVGSRTRIALESASASTLTVRHDLGSSGPVTTTLSMVRGSVACEDLELAPGRDQAEDGVREPTLEGRTLERSKRIPLALVPGGQALTELHVEEPACVDVLEQAGEATRVAIPRADDLLIGWIPTQALGPPTLCGRVGVLGHGAATGDGFGFAHDGTAKCAADVPVEVERAGRRRRVGFVRQGTLMALDERRGEHVTIDIKGSKVTLAPDAELLVERVALEGCELRLEPTLEESRKPFVWPRARINVERTRP